MCVKVRIASCKPSIVELKPGLGRWALELQVPFICALHFTHMRVGCTKRRYGLSHNAQCFYVILDQLPIMHNVFMMTRINSANFLHTA